MRRLVLTIFGMLLLSGGLHAQNLPFSGGGVAGSRVPSHEAGGTGGTWSGDTAAASPSGTRPEPIFTSRRAFRIPYQYDAEQIARLRAREVRLYVSRNQGQDWQAVQTVTPQAGRFDFRASADGEYWFAVQTVDGKGDLHPGGSVFQPGLIVIVDTQKPRLRIELEEAEPGRVALEWSAADANLDPFSIVLEFTQTGLSDWQPIGVKPSASGQTAWTVPTSGLVAVRGRASDLAGNEVQTQYQIQISKTSKQPSPSLPDTDGPIASRSRRDSASPHRGNTRSGEPRAPLHLPGPGFGAPGGSPAISSSDEDRRSSDSLTNPILDALPDSRPSTSGPPLRSRGSAAASAPDDQHLPGRGTPSATFGSDRRSTYPGASPDGSGSAGVPGFPHSMPGRSSDRESWRQDQFVAAVPGSGDPQEIARYDGSEHSGHRTVRSRQFDIDYRIDDIGPSGVASIELFVTQNDGGKWYRYGIDEDHRSPFEVEVPSDGVYGFALRVVSGAGLTDPPPQPGERPEITILVDSSPPVVKLFPLKQGQGSEANRILITWRAEDQELADRPIALSYSSSPDGPWQQITDWLPNTGQYIWEVGEGIPPRLFVRVVARDAAGNLARVDTPQPVLVDLAKPTARIVDVESSISSGHDSFR